jgi:hypothetical protein
MRYRYTVSCESESQPVHTVCGEFEVNEGAQAVRQGARAACTHWPRQRSFRSVVVVVERIEDVVNARVTQPAAEAVA